MSYFSKFTGAEIDSILESASTNAPDIIAKITDPENNPISEGSVRVVSATTELGGLNRNTGELTERDDAVRPINFISVSEAEAFTLNLSDPVEDRIPIYYYDANKNFIRYQYCTVGYRVELSGEANYIKFYCSATADTSIEFTFTIEEKPHNVKFKKIYIADHGYEIHGKQIDDATMHKLVIEAQGMDGNEYNITEIKAPSYNPKEATMCLMNAGNDTLQFVDFLSMRYDTAKPGTVEIVSQVRGTTPLAPVSVRFNNGKGNGRVIKLSIDPDSIPMRLTSRGLQVRRNNAYTNDWDDENTVDINLTEMFDKINVIYDALVANGTIQPIQATVTYPYVPCIEYGNLVAETGLNQSSGTDPHSSVRTRDFIPCVSGNTYTFTTNNDWTVYFYDSNKAMLSSQVVSNTGTATTPASAAYMRLLCSASNNLAEALTINISE